MNLNEIYAIREWAPCSNIIERIPTKPPRLGINLFANKELNITCIDAVDDFMAIGTDGGVIYWYNRETDELERLDPETTNAQISCLRIVDSVEYIVAAGDTSGKVHIFQIQKKLPADLELVAIAKKQTERYTVRELHAARISCCEWSRNGMKLYSGDLLGIVVITEFDFQKHISRSMEILSEAYEIVQLSVYRQHLLVCTLYRAVICCYAQQSGKWNLWQVGKKDRKQLEDCGGIFLPRAFGPPIVICGRPGQRFWLSDLEGNVEKTLLFRNALEQGANWEIPLLNPKQRRNNEILQIDANNNNFRQLQLYDAQQMLLVTHDSNNVYILNLENLCVEAVARGFRAILDICVQGREIFVLEGGRTLVRLAAQPEKPNRTSRIIFNPIMPPLLPTALNLVTNYAIEKPTELLEHDLNNISNNQCLELPPIEALSLDIPIELAVESPRSNHVRRFELFSKISNEDFDKTILHAHSTSFMDITDNELGKSKNNKVQQRKKSQETTATTTTAREKNIAETCKIIENAIMKSNGIVEIGKIAMHQDTKDSESPGIQHNSSLKEVCTEYIPELFESITMGKADRVPTHGTQVVDEPKEFCDINTQKRINRSMINEQNKVVIDGNCKSLNDNTTKTITTTTTTTTSETSTNADLRKVSEINENKVIIDKLSSTCSTNTTPLHEQQKATPAPISNADESYVPSDWEFLNN